MVKDKKEEKSLPVEDSGGKKSSKLEEIEQKLKECQKLRDEYLAGWQRARADFLNYKKEEAERLEKVKEFAEDNLILKILKVVDNLERAKKEIPEDVKNSGWIKGFFQIENQLKSFLKNEGVEEINPEGERFDPNFHEAVEEVREKTEKEDAGTERTDTEPKREDNKAERSISETGKVVEVLEKGYKRGEKLLREAKVKVSK